MTPSASERTPSPPGTQASQSADTGDIIVIAQQAQKQVVSDGNLGALGFQDALSTPFNVTSYTAQLVLDQQAQTIGDVLKNDPAVRITTGNGTQADLFVLRGFPVFGDDIAIDGLYGVTPRQLVSPELYENVQVLNGATSFLFGVSPGGSGVGGGINLTPKRASKALYRATDTWSAKDIFGGNIDVGRRFGAADTFGARLNAVYRKGENAIDGEDKEVGVVGLGLDARSGPMRAYLDLGYSHQRVDRPRPIVRPAATLAAIPAPPDDPSINWGQAWTYTRVRTR